MSKLSVENIEHSDNFIKLKELKYDDIINFVFENIRKKTPASIFYFFINAFNLLLIIYFLIDSPQNEGVTLAEFLRQFVTGLFAGSILVIPFHEGFHGLAYKITGAPKIHFGADLRQMIFYVTAHHYVIGRYAFYFIAFAPFLLINVAIIILFLETHWMELFTSLFFLFFHNIMCIGDFAMVSFYQQNKDKELFTYDNIYIKTSYIYEKLLEK